MTYGYIYIHMLSICFSMVCGVCQGGVLSPVLFAVYVDDFIERLNDNTAGYFIGDLYLDCSMYADDLILISASVSILQKMIFICEKEAEYIDMKFNTSQSVVNRIGKSYKNICENIELVGAKLDYVSKAKCLGVYIVLA